MLHERHQIHFVALAGVQLPRPMRTIAFLIIIMSTAVAVFLSVTPWVQTSPGVGSVTALNPDDLAQEINAFVTGRIQKWYIRDGDHVKVNDPIAKIVDNDPQLIERLQAERRQVRAQLSAAEAVAATARIDAERTEELFSEELAARRDYEQAKIKLQERLAAVAEAAAKLTRADVNLSRQSVQIVRAPRDGIILRVNAGDTSTFVSVGDSIATFVPDNVERVAEMFIDGRDVSLVRKGDKVRLQFEGWPVVQFSGWPSVAIGTFGGIVVAVDPSAQTNGRFRVLVKENPNDLNPWPDNDYVRFGSKVRGWIQLEKVIVGYELWRLFNNFPPDFRTRVDGSEQ
ncbi:MAG: efflux RND transporter periplasmic adaptor subunit [Gammaproteobacteria bacterium]|nr:efflux RND transporter periplasmic adaptor subunit [Gammaproteobacteria bacterium]